MKKFILHIIFAVMAFLFVAFTFVLQKPIYNAVPETEYLIGTLPTLSVVKCLWSLVEFSAISIFFIADGYLFAHFFIYFWVWLDHKEKEIRQAMEKSDPK